MITKIHSPVQRNESSEEQAQAVLRTLDVKPLEVVSIRPSSELEGNPFSGFSDPELRESYIRAGQESAMSVLATLND